MPHPDNASGARSEATMNFLPTRTLSGMITAPFTTLFVPAPLLLAPVFMPAVLVSPFLARVVWGGVRIAGHRERIGLGERT
jgi:hypothetical protein